MFVVFKIGVGGTKRVDKGENRVFVKVFLTIKGSSEELGLGENGVALFFD